MANPEPATRRMSVGVWIFGVLFVLVGLTGLVAWIGNLAGFPYFVSDAAVRTAIAEPAIILGSAIAMNACYFAGGLLVLRRNVQGVPILASGFIFQLVHNLLGGYGALLLLPTLQTMAQGKAEPVPLFLIVAGPVFALIVAVIILRYLRSQLA